MPAASIVPLLPASSLLNTEPMPTLLFLATLLAAMLYAGPGETHHDKQCEHYQPTQASCQRQ